MTKNEAFLLLNEPGMEGFKVFRVETPETLDFAVATEEWFSGERLGIPKGATVTRVDHHGSSEY